MASNNLKRFEKFSGSARVIVQDHAKIHDGDAYSCSVVTSNNAIANGGRYQMLMFNPSSFNFPHLRVYEWDTESAPSVISLYEAPTIQATGTLCPVTNLSRVTTNVSSVVVFSASSIDVTSRGTLLEEHLLSGAKSSGGSTENATVEWILAPATNYLLELHNTSGSASDVGFFAFWYE